MACLVFLWVPASAGMTGVSGNGVGGRSNQRKTMHAVHLPPPPCDTFP